MKKLNIAYFGSSYFSADFLEKILLDKELGELLSVNLIVTQPDQPVGRKQILTPTPVKKIADNFKLKTACPAKPWRSGENSKLKIKDIDLALLYAYGGIIPKDILDLPKYGFWCIHPSLLPLYRGTAPMATPLMNGEKSTGVTIIKMDEKIDHGPIIAQEKSEILPHDKRPDLEQRLTNLGFELFKKTIKNFANIKPVEQNHVKATLTRKLKKDDGFIPFENLKLALSKTEGMKIDPFDKLRINTERSRSIENSPEKLYNLFRGLYPWPGLWTILPNGKRLKIIDLSQQATRYTLHINKVQLEGKNVVDFKTFNKVYKIL